MQGQRINVDTYLMDKIGQLLARSMELLRLDLHLKNYFSTSLSLDNIRNKSHVFPCFEYNSIMSL